jgi:hypothetical protein
MRTRVASVAATVALAVTASAAFAVTSVTLPGDFQSELGCAGDWMPDCANTHLTYDAGLDRWVGTFSIPAGNWQYKVAIDDAWDENYGIGGVPNGSNYGMSIATPQTVTFSYDAVTHVVTTYAAIVPPSSVTLAGDLQSEQGCASDWMPDCANTHLTFNSGLNKWVGTFTLPAGSWQYKISINDSWDENYGVGGVPGGGNYSLTLGGPQMVTFTYDHGTHLLTDNSNAPLIVIAAGSFQSEAGCSGDWMPDCTNTQLLASGKLYSFSTSTLPPGDYEFKITIGQSWDENYGQNGVPGGANIPFTVPKGGAIVTITYDPATHVPNVIVDTSSPARPSTWGRIKTRYR